MLVLTIIVSLPYKSYAASLLSIYKHFLAIFVSSLFLENKKLKFKNLGIENGGLLNEIWIPN